MDIFENENSRGSQTPDWMNLFSDAGGGSDFGNIENFGIPDGSLFEGMVPGGLQSVGIRTTPEEINAIANLPDDKDFLSRTLKGIKDYVGKNPGQVGLMALLAALGAANKAPPSGGGVAKRYVGPSKPLARTIVQSKYGPVAQFAAQGGIMHAYASGGQVRPFPMQDGGFVMTKKAVDGAGGQGGLRSILPEAQPIQGPGHGTSDSIPAYIQGQNGKTPARVSNGESYVPPGRNTREMYALMKYLEGMGRRA